MVILLEQLRLLFAGERDPLAAMLEEVHKDLGAYVRQALASVRQEVSQLLEPLADLFRIIWH